MTQEVPPFAEIEVERRTYYVLAWLKPSIVEAAIRGNQPLARARLLDALARTTETIWQLRDWKPDVVPDGQG